MVQAPTRSDVTNVNDVGLKDVPLRSLFPDEPGPPEPGAPKLKVAIVGAGLAGLSTAVELLDQGYEVDIYEGRPWVGGKVSCSAARQCRAPGCCAVAGRVSSGEGVPGSGCAPGWGSTQA